MPPDSRARRPGHLLALIATALTVAAVPAGAQVRVAPLEVTRFHLGPLELTPTFEVRNLGIDNNVFNDSRRRRDSNLILGPGLEAFLPVGERLRVGGSGRADVGWFTEESDQRYVDLIGSTDAELDVGPLTLIAGASGGRQRQRFSIEIDDRIRRETRELRGGVGVSLGARTLLVLEGSTGGLRFDPSTARTPERGTEIKRALDRDTRQAEVELRYRLTDKTTLEITGTRREDEFLFDPADRSAARLWQVLGGFRFARTALVSGRLQAGMVRVPDASDQAVPPWSGLALEASLARNLAWFARLQLDARRRISWAVSRGILATDQRRNSFVDESYAARVSLGLPLDAVLRTSVMRERALFVLPVVQAGREVDRVDRRLSVRTNLLWPVGQRLRLGFHVTWQRRTSTLRGVAYEGWLYGLAAEVVP